MILHILEIFARMLHLIYWFESFDINGLDVKFMMNITDVGHLVSDKDTGEDKMEKSAKKEGKTAWEVAKFYTDAFIKDYEALHYTMPERFAKATDHIQEQIALIKRLEEQGYTYIISDGVYFDTSKLEDYGKLSTLDQKDEGVARVEVNEEKEILVICSLEVFLSKWSVILRQSSGWLRSASPDGMEKSLGQGFPWLAY
jgi:cysteinyl-tRNA synthetase